MASKKLLEAKALPFLPPSIGRNPIFFSFLVPKASAFLLYQISNPRHQLTTCLKLSIHVLGKPQVSACAFPRTTLTYSSRMPQPVLPVGCCRVGKIRFTSRANTCTCSMSLSGRKGTGTLLPRAHPRLRNKPKAWPRTLFLRASCSAVSRTIFGTRIQPFYSGAEACKIVLVLGEFAKVLDFAR